MRSLSPDALLSLTPEQIFERFSPKYGSPSSLSDAEISRVTKAGTIDDGSFAGAGALNDEYFRRLGDVMDTAPIGLPGPPSARKVFSQPD
jgi:hypothetical protein